MSQMTIRASSVATFESFELDLPALSRASSSRSSSISSGLPLTPTPTSDSHLFIERGAAQSPIQYDALRALGGAASKRPTRPLVGLGYDFLPSIHAVLADAEEEEEEMQTSMKETILDTPACDALFNTPYVEALFDILSPEIEQREWKLTQMFWMLVGLVTGLVPGLWLACHGVLMLVRLRNGGEIEAIVCALCATFVFGLAALCLFSLLGVFGAASLLRTCL
ncbi:hypothetical protein AURDEDRAFT_160742 [Auricularia subglabra TFB-10046 SS5]|nr:hypothetical protein AURDEDRAFT_160742 [Auricularia subglabra TFB-10046 SS5]